MLKLFVWSVTNSKKNFCRINLAGLWQNIRNLWHQKKISNAVSLHYKNMISTKCWNVSKILLKVSVFHEWTIAKLSFSWGWTTPWVSLLLRFQRNRSVSLKNTVAFAMRKVRKWALVLFVSSSLSVQVFNMKNTFVQKITLLKNNQGGCFIPHHRGFPMVIMPAELVTCLSEASG